MSRLSDEQFSIAAESAPLNERMARQKAERERDEACAAAGAMRLAVQEWLDADQAADTPKLIRKLCEPTIGADVMRVVGAARKIRHWHDTVRDGSRMIVSAGAVRELWSALAALTNSAGGK